MSLPKFVACQGQDLFIYSMGKRFRVTGIFASDPDANDHCERHTDDGVIAVMGPFIFTAGLYSGDHVGKGEAVSARRDPPTCCECGDVLDCDARYCEPCIAELARLADLEVKQ